MSPVIAHGILQVVSSGRQLVCSRNGKPYDLILIDEAQVGGKLLWQCGFTPLASTLGSVANELAACSALLGIA